MATRTLLYLDFPEGEVKEVGASDTVALNVTSLIADYTGLGGKFVRVAATADVLEYVTIESLIIPYAIVL